MVYLSPFTYSTDVLRLVSAGHHRYQYTDQQDQTVRRTHDWQ
jgi:hypothetical protein